MFDDRVVVPSAARPTWPPRAAAGSVDLLAGVAAAPSGSHVPPTSVVAGSSGGWTAVVGHLSPAAAERLAVRPRIDLDDEPNGVALVRWDPSGPRLELARSAGPSPSLHVRKHGSEVEWAVRLADLVRPGDRLDAAAAAAFLAAGRITVGRALVAGVERVSPGEVVVVDRTGIRRRWAPREDWPEEVPRMPRHARLDRLRSELVASVDRMVGRSGTNAIGLSSGIDSTVLAVVMAAHLGLRPLTFTVRFPGQAGPMDEFEAADVTARALGLRHEPLLLRPEFVVDHLDWMVDWFDGPFVHAVHTADLAVAAGAGVLVSGAGGDAWSLLRNQRHGLALRRLPPRVVRPVASLARRLTASGVRGGARLTQVTRYAGDLSEALAEARGRMPPPLLAAVLGPEVAAGGRRLLHEHFRLRVEALEHLRTDLALKYLRGYVSTPDKDADWTFRWAGAYGLRPAMPFLDPGLTRVLAPLVTDRGDRVELRELAAERIPRHAAFRSKVGQTVPLAEWFRGPLRELVDETLAAEALTDGGLLDPSSVRRLVDRHMTGIADHHWDLLAIMTLVRWGRRVAIGAPTVGGGA